MTRAVLLLVENADGSETAAAVLQIDGDIAQASAGADFPRRDRLFSAPTAYAEGLAHDARKAGDIGKARLEDWVDWIVEELAGIDRRRVVEVAPARDLEDLYDREITLHPPEGSRPGNDEEDEEEPEARQQSRPSAGRSPAAEETSATQPDLSGLLEPNTAVTPFFDRLLKESRARNQQPSRITIQVPPKRTSGHGRRTGEASSPSTLVEIGPSDNLLALIPDGRPEAFDALMPGERALRGRIFLVLWASGYSEAMAWAVALARDVSGVTGPGGFVDISDDRSIASTAAARRMERT